ncbi:glycine--tRNA ligase subunit beta [Kyrpidia sp.]|uniref:glycine--tRNA ligase subunit beta n=1 Tax=Kyrpidia sp. TaxID=2073077 RepID=UPI00258EB064|nr:glycine--tRNA ligase subunit beta [Kyrpidia sp.]MCL6577143.1 glycine--tRNA ligase subunit beta [Kyrpidia sp.]
MAAPFLLEIGVEELPARFVPEALEQLRVRMSEWLEAQRLAHGAVQVYGTPRRLTLYAADLAERQEDREFQVRGPSLKAAKGPDGRWTKAAEGFARSQGVAVDDLVERGTPQGVYVYALKREAGLRTPELLAGYIPELVLGLSFPKTMRWGTRDVRFARPIRWLVALYGEEVVPAEVAGVKTGRISRGHRTLHPGPVEIPGAEAYVDMLDAAFVMVDVARRKEVIVDQVRRAAEEIGGQAVIDEELLEEVVHLVEWPTAFAGAFDRDFLQVPPEVIMLTMKENQRYFPVVDGDGGLIPGFVGVRNGGDHRLDVVRAGNEKVLRARLADAKFFYDEDRKIAPIRAMERLRNIVFQEGAGTMYDKVERVRRVALALADRLGLGPRDVETVEAAGRILKFDLATHMVYEFPELEGVMGRYYALEAGEGSEVAEAILEHHRPRFPGDDLPGSPAGTVLAVADKADTLCASFYAGIRPTGSEDPYGLRRNALGLLQILRYLEIPIALGEILDLAEEALRASGFQDGGTWRADLDSFVTTRLRTWLLEEGRRHDLVDAILGRADEPLAVLIGRVRFYESLADEGHSGLYETAGAAKRVHNLAKKGEGLAGEPDPGRFQDDAERALHEASRLARQELEAARAAGDEKRALDAMGHLNRAVHPFFDRVMVLVEDEEIRENRLRLLRDVADVYNLLLDWRQVVLS